MREKIRARLKDIEIEEEIRVLYACESGSRAWGFPSVDSDYDGRSLFPRQVFFPMAGEKEGWARLARSLKAEIDEELIEM